jgi:hypothetical protein
MADDPSGHELNVGPCDYSALGSSAPKPAVHQIAQITRVSL